jgi:opacity protein-like surface antigen
LGVRLHGTWYHAAHPQSGLVRRFCLVCVGVLGWIGYSDFAEGADLDASDAANTVSTLPNIYLDLTTVYSRVPAGSLSIGFSNPSSVSSAIATLATLSTLSNATSPNLSAPASQSIGINVPLTVDLNDRVSVYGGFGASALQSGLSDRSALAISSWNVGFWANVYQQNGGSIPSITLQSTLTRSVPDSPLATTSLNSILEFDYALNKNETKGLLAGVQDVAVSVDSPLAKVNPDIVGYLGGYYQWANNWELTGRAGIQWFGGASLLNLTPFQPFTQPIVRFDLDRYDDNGNRLFGVTAEIAWTPKPAYQLTVRTPLYFVRN